MDMKVENITHGAISVVDVREKVERYEEIIFPLDCHMWCQTDIVLEFF